MQLLVISDTHGNDYALERILIAHPKVDLIIHCGDGEEELDAFLAVHPEYASRVFHVCGNCDYTQRSPRMLTLQLPYAHKLVAVHGHYQQSGDYKENLVRLAHAEEADLVLFGHFHTRCDETIDGVRLFNPGSAAKPRDGLPASYGLIDILEEGILTSHGEVSLLK